MLIYIFKSRGKAPGQRGQGAKPPEAESNLKTKCAILRSGFHYLTFWCFQIFRPLLLTCYIPLPLMQKHILCCKRNLLESCFRDGSIYVWAICGIFGA